MVLQQHKIDEKENLSGPLGKYKTYYDTIVVIISYYCLLRSVFSSLRNISYFPSLVLCCLYSRPLHASVISLLVFSILILSPRLSLHFSSLSYLFFTFHISPILTYGTILLEIQHQLWSLRRDWWAPKPRETESKEIEERETTRYFVSGLDHI